MKRRTKVALGVLLTLVTAGVALRFVPEMLWGDGKDYSRVHSIREEPTFQDPTLLGMAWAMPVAARYRKNLDYQDNGSLCGPATLVNVMRSLGRPADQQGLLAGSDITTVGGFLPGGITLDQLAALVRRRLPDAEVTVLRGLDAQAFHAEIEHANDPDRRLIVNFHRGPLFAKGGGHHSPIAAYMPDQDLVMVLDVNREYRPWLVQPQRLFEAVDTVDPMAKKKRGLLRIRTRTEAVPD